MDRLQWWAYMLIAFSVFLLFLALNYLVKIINGKNITIIVTQTMRGAFSIILSKFDNRFEERMNRLYGKTSTCTQVQVPLIEIETKKSAANQETPKGISLVFTKEDNKHRYIETMNLDRINEKDKSINNSAQPLPLGTIYSSKRFSSHDNFGKTQSETVKTNDHAKAVIFRTAQDVRMPSPMDSVESIPTYKIKESNAVENFKENILTPVEYTIHDHASVSSLVKLPEHLFKEPNSDVFASRSDNNTSHGTERNISKETVSKNISKAESKPSTLISDDITLKANQSYFGFGFMESNITLHPEVSNASSIFNPGLRCLGNIYQDNSLLPKGRLKTTSYKTNDSTFDHLGPKDSVIDVAKDYSDTSKETDKILRLSSNKILCNDIVQGMVNKLDKGDEGTSDGQ